MHRFESKLVDIMLEVKGAYDKLEGRLHAEGCKLRVLRILQALDDSIYHKDYVNKLRTTFLGLKEQVKSFCALLKIILIFFFVNRRLKKNRL